MCNLILPWMRKSILNPSGTCQQCCWSSVTISSGLYHCQVSGKALKMGQVIVTRRGRCCCGCKSRVLRPLLTDDQGGGARVGEGGCQGRGLARPDRHHPRQGGHDQVLRLLAQRVWALLQAVQGSQGADRREGSSRSWYLRERRALNVPPAAGRSQSCDKHLSSCSSPLLTGRASHILVCSSIN